jgi:hypothetical protein
MTNELRKPEPLETDAVRTVYLAATIVMILVFWGCVTKATEWVPMDTATRAAQYWQNVEYLEAPPGPDRPYTVVGIITPRGAFGTEAEAINYLRQVAAEHGADAIFFETKPSTGDAGPHWWDGGSPVDPTHRAKAIAWGK